MENIQLTPTLSISLSQFKGTRQTIKLRISQSFNQFKCSRDLEIIQPTSTLYLCLPQFKGTRQTMGHRMIQSFKKFQCSRNLENIQLTSSLSLCQSQFKGTRQTMELKIIQSFKQFQCSKELEKYSTNLNPIHVSVSIQRDQADHRTLKLLETSKFHGLPGPFELRQTQG